MEVQLHHLYVSPAEVMLKEVFLLFHRSSREGGAAATGQSQRLSLQDLTHSGVCVICVSTATQSSVI